MPRDHLGLGRDALGKTLFQHLGDARVELLARALVPHTWLECGATPYTEGTPFHPVSVLVAQGLGFAPDDTAAEQLDKLERGLAALASTETPCPAFRTKAAFGAVGVVAGRAVHRVSSRMRCLPHLARISESSALRLDTRYQRVTEPAADDYAPP